MTLLVHAHGLRSLDLSNNYLSNIPVQTLFNLTKLDLSKNFFTDIPLLVTQATRLQQLDMSNNRLTELSIAKLLPVKDSLKTLNISCNSDLTALPTDLLLLDRLEKLDVTDLVSLKSPPYSLAKNGLESIRKYMQRKQHPKWLMRGKTS